MAKHISQVPEGWTAESDRFAQCTDCGGHLYRTTRDVYGCDAGHDPLATEDIYLEFNEAWLAARDDTGRLALASVTYAVPDEQEV